MCAYWFLHYLCTRPDVILLLVVTCQCCWVSGFTGMSPACRAPFTLSALSATPAPLLPGCCFAGRQGWRYSVTSLSSGFPSLNWGAASPSGFCEDIGASPHEAVRPRVARGIQQILNQAFIFPLRTAPAPDVDLMWTCFIAFRSVSWRVAFFHVA